VAIRRVLADATVWPVLDVGDVDRGSTTDPLDLGPWSPREVLVVSADPDILAAAGAVGAHRLVGSDPEATAAAAVELIGELHRP
jgi:hypothetical protein